MPSIAKLMPESRSSDINCGWGLTARMTYNPRRITITPNEAEELKDESEENKSRLADELCRVVTGWDVEGPVPLEPVGSKAPGSVVPEGAVIPLDPDVVRYLPQPLLAGMVIGITMDAQPDPKAMQTQSRGRGSTPTTTP